MIRTIKTKLKVVKIEKDKKKEYNSSLILNL